MIFDGKQMGHGRMGKMNRVKLAFVILAAGVLTTIISTTADLTGLGTYDGFGPYQLFPTSLGVILIIIGIILIISHNRGSN